MLPEIYKFVPILSDQDLNAGASMVGDSINMATFHSVTFICGLQTLGGADPVVTVYSGLTDAALTTALTFNYAYGGAATGSADCDVLSAWSTSAALTIANASKDNFMLLIQVDAKAMGSGHKWLTIEFSDPSVGATGNVQVHAILRPRYTKNRSLSALV